MSDLSVKKQLGIVTINNNNKKLFHSHFQLKLIASESFEPQTIEGSANQELLS